MLLAAVSASRSAQGQATISQPERVSFSADGRSLVFVIGDTMWVQRLDARGASAGKPVFVAAGMRRIGGMDREFQALSADGRHLVFRTGHGGVHDMGDLRVALLSDAVRVIPLVPDSLARRLQTFMHFAAGGPSWSPDGRRVAFLAADMSRGDQTLQVYVATPELGRVDRWTNGPRMNWSAVWSPDGGSLAVASSDPDSSISTITLLDAVAPAHGVSAELMKLHAEWVNDLLWSPDGKRLVVQRDSGVPILVSVDAAGLPRVARMPLPMARYAAWTPDGRSLLAHRPDGMSSRLLLVDSRSGAAATLMGRDTLFRAVGTGGQRDRVFVALTAESGGHPREILTVRLSGRNGVSSRQVVARSRGLTDSTALPEYRVFRWIAANGQTLDAQLFLPRRTDSRSPRPLVIVPYGGFINNFPDAEDFLDGVLLELNRRGWAVVLPNTRGAASDNSHVGHYGDVQLEDTDRLVSALGAARLADTTRVSVIGHSHGASLAYYYLTHSSRFCAVVAVNGRADWELQARHGDAYLINQMGGMPDSLADRYARFSPTRNAASVTTPLLAVSGARDTQILPSNADMMVDSLHALGKRAELLAFADEGHILSKPDNVRRFRQAVFALLGKSCGRSYVK